MAFAALDRTELFADTTLRGADFAKAHAAVLDRWLVSIFDEIFERERGVALVATGGHGRAELCPFSDLDLLLLHDGALNPDLAQQFWYPL